jgi:hypothetical protein
VAGARHLDVAFPAGQDKGPLRVHQTLTIASQDRPQTASGHHLRHRAAARLQERRRQIGQVDKIEGRKTREEDRAVAGRFSWVGFFLAAVVFLFGNQIGRLTGAER